MNKPNHSVPHSSHDNPQVSAAERHLDGLIAGMTTSGSDHEYLTANALDGVTVQVLAGKANVGPTQCDHAAAAIIYNPKKRPANLLAMVIDANGNYEDVLIPGAQLAGCYARIGEKSDSVLIAETYAEGFALHCATASCVAVALYAENIKDVAMSVKQYFPDASIIICAGKHEGPDGESNMRNATEAASAVQCSIAIPKPAATFDELYRLHGSGAVQEQIAAASFPEGAPFISTGHLPSHGIPSNPRLWPNAVNGPSMIEALIVRLTEHIVMTSHELLALALWILFTHTLDAARVCPILSVRSPVKRCGKTSLMTLLAGLVANPYAASNVTAAVLYRMIDQNRPTLLLDESDTYLGESAKAMTGIINSGHTRTLAVVRRVEKNEVKSYSTFFPKAIAGIGPAPGTIKDRSININLKRKRTEDSVFKYAPGPNDNIVPLRAQIARWARDNLDRIAAVVPALGNLKNDRYEDNWEPLFAIAECLGTPWLERAQTAALALSEERDTEAAGSEALLRDIRKAFDAECTAKLTSSRLIELLCADSEGPWAAYANGKQVTPRDVATLLDVFDIKSKSVRVGAVVMRGYELEQFQDAFARYLHDQTQ